MGVRKKRKSKISLVEKSATKWNFWGYLEFFCTKLCFIYLWLDRDENRMIKIYELWDVYGDSQKLKTLIPDVANLIALIYLLSTVLQIINNLCKYTSDLPKLLYYRITCVYNLCFYICCTQVSWGRRSCLLVHVRSC